MKTFAMVLCILSLAGEFALATGSTQNAGVSAEKSAAAATAAATIPMASAGVETHGVQRGLPADAKRLVETKQVIVVDVREANELASGMALGAMHMPLSQVEADGPEFKKFLAGLPKDKEIWFYCRSGRRSGIVSEKMNSLGFRVRNAGGFSDWQSAGLPTK